MEDNITYPGCKVPVYSTIADFCAFYAHPKKPYVNEAGIERNVGIGRWWIGQAQRRQYDGIVYAPNAAAKATHGKLNLWTGFACKPVEGDCSRTSPTFMTTFAPRTRSITSTCSTGWPTPCRTLVGRARSRSSCAATRASARGLGLGSSGACSARTIGTFPRPAISPATSMLISSSARSFSPMRPFSRATRRMKSILKAIITEQTLMIEPKGLNSYPVRNCLHIIMSSNSDWVVPAGADARRYFVVTVGDAHKQDHPYFAAIVKQMESGGREALLHHLLSRDLSDFNVRDVPQTEALADQKAHSRRGIDRLVEILAHEGVLPAVHPVLLDVAVTTGEAKGEGFYAQAKALVPDLKFPSSVVINAALKNWGCKPWRAHGVRGIQFPPLKELRDAFDKRHGKQTWPDDEEWGRDG